MNTTEGVRSQQRRYRFVFVSLLCLTGLTVAVAELDVPIAYAVSIALTIAVVKATLVARAFMHLDDERLAVYAVIALAVLHMIGLVVTPTLGHWDRARF